MSRIGKQLISIPQGVNVTVDANNVVTVTGPKGTLSREINKGIKVVVENNEVKVLNETNDKNLSKFHGLSRQLINNMIIGVTKGFEKRLTINGVGYRITQQGPNLVLNIGLSHPVELKPKMPIAQLVIEDSYPCDKLYGEYNNHYQHQKGATLSWMDKN